MFATLITRINSRPSRERIAMLVGVLAALHMVTNVLAVPRLKAVEHALDQEISAKQLHMTVLSAEVQRLRAEVVRDPDATLRARLQELQHQVSGLDQTAAAWRASLVSPVEMGEVLKALLRTHSGIRVLLLENLPSQPADDVTPKLKSATAKATASTAKPTAEGEKPPPRTANLYRHGLRLQVEGRYGDLVAFLDAVEHLPKRLLWGEARLEAGDDALSDLTVTFYTLSPEAVWLAI